MVKRERFWQFWTRILSWHWTSKVCSYESYPCSWLYRVESIWWRNAWNYATCRILWTNFIERFWIQIVEWKIGYVDWKSSHYEYARIKCGTPQIIHRKNTWNSQETRHILKLFKSIFTIHVSTNYLINVISSI